MDRETEEKILEEIKELGMNLRKEIREQEVAPLARAILKIVNGGTLTEEEKTTLKNLSSV